jgi:hypothetical protein
MKRFYFIATIWFIGSCLTACTEKTTVDPTDGGIFPVEQPDDYASDVGIPQGTPVTQVVGTTGGTVRDAEGRFSIQIPAGALATEQTISIQPVNNTNSAGKGTAYRLTPHGLTFAKPVKLTVQYTAEDLSGTIPEAFGIAYQNEDKIWMSVGGVKLDTAARTLSVATTHFSDWSFFEAITLEMAVNVISPGEKAKAVVHCALNSGPDEDPLADLTREGTERKLLQSGKVIATKYIDGWEKVNEGRLTVSGSSVEYLAPTSIPKTNPVELIVRIKLKDNALGMIIRKLYVAPPGISVQVNGSAWRTIPGGIAPGPEGLNLIAGFLGDGAITIKWEGPFRGVFPWTLETVACLYQASKMDMYQHVYGTTSVSISKGYLTTEEAIDFTEHARLVGSFDVKSAGHMDFRDPAAPRMTTEKMHGVFRIK